jgi:hypothetical protein
MADQLRTIGTAILAMLAVAGVATAAPIAADQIEVIDGGTVRILSLPHTPHVSLVGFIAPKPLPRIMMWSDDEKVAERQRENFYASEAERGIERNLAKRARARLTEIMKGAGVLDFEMVRCTPPAIGGKRLSYHCGTLLADGRDVGSVLIAEGLAVAFVCGNYGCPLFENPWRVPLPGQPVRPAPREAPQVIQKLRRNDAPGAADIREDGDRSRS